MEYPIPANVRDPVAGNSDHGMEAAQTLLTMKGNRRILVVDDEPAIRRLAARMLKLMGMDVVEAGDGHEALKCLEHPGNQVDAILTDFRLPDIQGTDLAVWMREKIPGIPIIYFTGSSPQEIPTEELAREDTHFLGKPFTKESLHVVLNNVFAVC
jgi:two-component system cell cycle sensor histidine kinase/response regulator CckA